MHRSFSVGILIYALVLLVRSSPVATDGDDGQIPFLVSDTFESPRYGNGELPPTENTEGWVDPRLNGGRFIDVRSV